MKIEYEKVLTKGQEQLTKIYQEVLKLNNQKTSDMTNQQGKTPE